MACPKCGCREVYAYDDDEGEDDRLQRCAACGVMFDLDDHAEEDDDVLKWIDVKTLTVRREFRAGEWSMMSGETTPCLDLRRDCGLGCECSAQLLKAVPGADLAEQKSLCFNDRTKQGISEMKGTAKAIKEGPDEWIYEVQAKLVEAKQDAD